LGHTLLEVFDVLGGKGDPYLVDLFLGLLQPGLCGLHRSVCSHCSHRCRETEEEDATSLRVKVREREE